MKIGYVITLLVFYLKGFSQQTVPFGQFHGVYNLSYRGATFTGFLCERKGKVYLATVRHAFDTTFFFKRKEGERTIVIRKDSSNLKNGALISIWYRANQTWNQLKVNIFFHPHRSVDIVLLKLTAEIPGVDLTISSNHIHLGDDCFFIGYPLGLRMEKQFDEDSIFSLPLIKKGLISGGMENEDKEYYFLIDCNNTYGFSGSPVIFYDYEIKKWKVTAIMSGYIPQINKTYDSLGQEVLSTENSGIAIAYNADLTTAIVDSITAF